MPPVAGSLAEQPATFTRRAYYLESIYELMKDWYEHKSNGWNDNQRALFDYIMRLKKRQNDH